jgi:hypothetical protein
MSAAANKTQPRKRLEKTEEQLRQDRAMAKLIARRKTLQHEKGVAVQKIESHLVDVKAEWDGKLSIVKSQIKALKEDGTLPLGTINDYEPLPATINGKPVQASPTAPSDARVQLTADEATNQMLKSGRAWTVSPAA